MKRSGFLLLFLAIAACATPSPPPPADPPSLRSVEAADAVPLFEFRTGFWVSLHHHLRGEARRLVPAREGKLARNPDPAALPASERAAWEASLAAYEKTMAKRDLLFGDGMAEIKDALAELGDAPDLSTLRGRFGDEDLDALERAAPVYRTHLWPEHERLAKKWIAGMAPLLERHGSAIATRLAALYGSTWPSPVPIEVLPEAGPVGAYSTGSPPRVSLTGQDPRMAGSAGLEILFHEASHGWGGELRNPLATEANRRGVIIRDDLWHVVLFYVAGTVVRDELVGSGAEPEYVLYIDANRLWEGNWQGLREPISAACDPWLRGERSREEALAALAGAIGKPSRTARFSPGTHLSM